MKRNAILAFDGSMSHRRRARECAVLILDSELEKVVDFEIFQKSKDGEQVNYEGSSNGIEVAALRQLITRLKNNPLVLGFVHDRDREASKAIRDSG
jgi:hypothetical protein